MLEAPRLGLCAGRDYHNLMGDPKNLILIQPDGNVRVPGEEAKHELSQHAGRFRVVVGPPGLIVLRELQKEQFRAGARVLVAGEIVSKTTVLEIITMVGNFSWRGELHVYGPDSHRALIFDQGALRSASSQVFTERLGQVLVSRGVITQQQLADCVVQQDDRRRLGQILVEEGYLEREQLFEQLRIQAQQIFYSALLVREGNYLFALSDEDAVPPAVSFRLPIQGLLMEGVQRIDEMALFRQRIPSSQLCPVVSEAGPAMQLADNLRPVAGLIDGKRTISDISYDLGWDEFQTTKAVYQLLQKGCVELRASKLLDRAKVKRIVEQFNQVMREIFRTVAEHGGAEDTRETLTVWIHGSGYAGYFGDRLSEDGTIVAERVATALEQVDIERPTEALFQALHELVSFAMFVTTTSLPRNAELVLAKDVNRRLEDIHL